MHKLCQLFFRYFLRIAEFVMGDGAAIGALILKEEIAVAIFTALTGSDAVNFLSRKQADRIIH